MDRLRHDRSLPLVAFAAAFVTAGGWIHLREWLDTYREIPSDTPGAAVVQVGFPVHVVLSALAVAALLATAARYRRLLPAVIGATLVFQAGALVSLFVTRSGSLLGWTEPVWTRGAEQTRGVEAGAIVALLLAATLLAAGRRQLVPARARS